MFVIQKDIWDYDEEDESTITIGVCENLEIAKSYIHQLCKNTDYTKTTTIHDLSKVGGYIIEASLLSENVVHRYWIQQVEKIISVKPNM